MSKMNVKVFCYIFFLYFCPVSSDWSRKMLIAKADALCQSSCWKNVQKGECRVTDCCTGGVPFKLADFSQIFTVTTLPSLRCISRSGTIYVWKKDGDFAYFYEIRGGEKNETVFTKSTLCHYGEIVDIPHDANSLFEYHIRHWSVSYEQKIILKSHFFKYNYVTRKKEVAEPIKCKVNGFVGTEQSDNYSCSANITWTPNAGKSCVYRILTMDNETFNGPVQQIKDVVFDSYEILIPNQKFLTEYSTVIVAEDLEIESEQLWCNYTTPPCLSFFKNLSICVPLQPTGLEFEESYDFASRNNNTHYYDVQMNWDEPYLIPDYYLIHVTNEEGFINLSFNVSGNATSYLIKTVEYTDYWHLSLKAYSPAGASPVAVVSRRQNILFHFGLPWTYEKLAIALGFPILFLIGVYIVVNIRRYTWKPTRYDNGMTVEKKWEIKESQLIFEEIVGQGAYGFVRRAIRHGKGIHMTVAVKSMHEKTPKSEKQHFYDEIQFMKRVKKHRNVLKMLGCVVLNRATNPLLVVEYYQQGDLLRFLTNAHNRLPEEHRLALIREGRYQVPTANCDFFANMVYEFNDVQINKHTIPTFQLEPKHLLEIARQVAIGMQHLGYQRIIHRDLAARNVLVRCRRFADIIPERPDVIDINAKVSDFGLSRFTQKDDKLLYYSSLPNLKVPLKWMAVESLMYCRFSVKSDIWSYGILLWEIFTLGATPYSSVPNAGLIEYLKSGKRLGRPGNCPVQVYKVMKDCWILETRKRPTFKFLVQKMFNLYNSYNTKLPWYEPVDPINEPSSSVQAGTPKPKKKKEAYQWRISYRKSPETTTVEIHGEVAV